MSKFMKAVIPLAYLYCILPLLIFFVGWLKIYIALPAALVLAAAFWLCIKNAPDTDIKTDKNSAAVMLAALLTTVILVYLSGIGKFAYQNSDHTIRNTLFNILVDREWPVKGAVPVNGAYEWRGLIYYIGFWLPAAVFGKVFGIGAGYCFQFVWAVLGVFILYLLVCRAMGRISFWPLLVFILFGGLDVVGFHLLYGMPQGYSFLTHIEWWADSFQFSSFTTQLFWVFNQSIPAWIITMLACVQKNNRNMVFLLGLSLLNSTLPFVGMIPVFACLIFERLEKTEGKPDIKAAAKNIFTFENVVGGGAAGILSFIYLKNNTSGQAMGSAVGTASPGAAYYMLALLFLLFEVGVYYIAVFKYGKKKPMYYVTLLWLVICPFVKVGGAADFCMRASVPALLVLYLMVIKTLQKAYEAKDKITLCLTIAVLVLGAFSSLHEISRSIVLTAVSDGHPQNPDASEFEVMTGGNFTGPVEGNLFFEYLAK